MPDIQAGRSDFSQSAPGEPFEDPFEPATSWCRRLELPLLIALDDPEKFVDPLVDEVLSLPPGRRFSESREVLRKHLREEFGSVEALESGLPVDSAELARRFGDDVERALDETLQGVFFHQEPDAHLFVAAALESIRWAIRRSLHGDSEQARDRAIGAVVTMLCRLYWTEADYEDDGVPDALLRDVLGTVNVLVGPEETAFDVADETTSEELRRMVEVYGAVVAYRDLDISVGRGAELLGCSHGEFEDLLERFGIEPRYGPSSVDELREDTLVDE